MRVVESAFRFFSSDSVIVATPPATLTSRSDGTASLVEKARAVGHIRD